MALTWVSVCHSTLNFRNRNFWSELFGSRDFSILVVMVSKHFGQAMKSCRNLACLLFNANLLQSAEGFMEKKTANMIQDATVNQHQLMTFIIMALLQNVTFSLFYFYFFCFAFIRKKILDVEIVMKTNFSKVSPRNLGFLLFRVSCLCLSSCEASTRYASVKSGSHQDPLLRSTEELFASYLTPTSIKNRHCTRK